MVLDGGGWYGGGSAGNYAGSSRNYAAGGGGGSGFVWTSSATVPDGYLVSESYHLTNAGTYKTDETEFITNPNTDGNGYARITLVTGTVTTENEISKTGNRWISIETQLGDGTGTFDYNGNSILEKVDSETTITHN